MKTGEGELAYSAGTKFFGLPTESSSASLSEAGTSSSPRSTSEGDQFEARSQRHGGASAGLGDLTKHEILTRPARAVLLSL